MTTVLSAVSMQTGAHKKKKNIIGICPVYPERSRHLCLVSRGKTVSHSQGCVLVLQVRYDDLKAELDPRERQRVTLEVTENSLTMSVM